MRVKSQQLKKHIAATVSALILLNVSGLTVPCAFAQAVDGAPTAAGLLPASIKVAPATMNLALGPMVLNASNAGMSLPSGLAVRLAPAAINLRLPSSSPAALNPRTGSFVPAAGLTDQTAPAAIPTAAAVAAPLTFNESGLVAASKSMLRATGRTQSIADRVASALQDAGSIGDASPGTAFSLGRRIQNFLNVRHDGEHPGSADGMGNDGARQTDAQSQMLFDLKREAYTYLKHYGPRKWKERQQGVDVLGEYQKARARVLANPQISKAEFRVILADFIAALRDYHAGISFYSTKESKLLVKIRSAEGRYFIHKIDASLPKSIFPYKIGDEIIEFNGQPVAQAVAALGKTPNNPETDAFLNEMTLVRRSGRRGMNVPQGTVALKIKTSDGVVHDAKLERIYRPELIPDIPLGNETLGPEAAANPEAPGLETSGTSPAAPTPNIPAPKAPPSAKESIRQIVRKLIPTMAHPLAKLFMDEAAENSSKNNMAADDDFISKISRMLSRLAASPLLPETGSSAAAASEETEDGYAIAGKRSFLPNLGEIVWQFDPEIAEQVPFHAYIYKNAKGQRIGYIRISDYMGGGMDVQQAAQIFAKLIQAFDKKTDALVVDQMNNPGGDMFYMYTLLSMLTTKPLTVQPHQMMLDDGDAEMAVNILEEAKKPGMQDLIKEVFQEELAGFQFAPTSEEEPPIVGFAKFILSELKDMERTNTRRLTQKRHLFGIERIDPNPAVHYSKPWVMLINPADWSAADIAPAIVQDNQAATIYGIGSGGANGKVRTAGAGGGVKSIESLAPNLFGIERFSYTWTILWRTVKNATGSILQAAGAPMPEPADTVNEQPIENIGVTADKQHILTVKDMQENYAPLVKDLNDLLMSLIPDALGAPETPAPGPKPGTNPRPRRNPRPMDGQG